MARTTTKSVRVTDEQWNRIETAVGNSKQSPNHLLVQLAMEALDRREWPRTELDIRLMLSTLFTAEVTARNKIAEGCKDEVEEIWRKISRITPELPRPTLTLTVFPMSAPGEIRTVRTVSRGLRLQEFQIAMMFS